MKTRPSRRNVQSAMSLYSASEETAMSDQRTVRVLTLDSLPVIHAGVAQLLAAFADLDVVGQAYTVAEALQFGACSAPDVVLIEIRDLGAVWPEAFGSLAWGLPGVALVAFTATVEVDTIRQMLQLGAKGYLLKNIAALDLAHGLRNAANGRTAFAPEALEAALALHRDPEPGPLLSPREREVLTLLAHGLSNGEIAARLSVTAATVKYHCRTIYQKLHVTTRGQAVAKAYTSRLVPLTWSEAEPAQRPSEPGARLTLVRRA